MRFVLSDAMSQRIGVPSHFWQKYSVTDYDTCIFLEFFKERPGSKILVVGAHDEPSANMLAEMGHNVTGIDLREYDKDLPPCNYTFLRGDFCGMDLSGLGKFDVFVALSCIEHFGMGTYKEGPQHRYYDVVAMRRAWEMLKDGGHAYVTIPMCGYFNEVWPHWRTYDLNSVKERLVQDFALVDLKGVVSGNLMLPDGRMKKAGEGLTTEELKTFTGMPPHYSALMFLEKVPVKRLSPDGR